MSPLAWFVCVIVGSIGYGVGVWRGERHDDAMRAEGERDFADLVLERLQEGYAPRLTLDGESWLFWKVAPDETVFAVRPPHDPARPDDDLDVGSVALDGAGADALPPGVPAAAGSGPAPVARGYGPYLAAIGRDDPAGWYANLAAGEPPPEPGPRAEPAWVERLLHQGAISTAWCEATLHDTAEYFRADEAAVERQIERWVKAARWQLVGSRSWPHPDLAGAA